MKVTELKAILEKMELYGYGDTETYVGFPTRLGYGVESPREIISVSSNTLFGKDIIYIKIK